MIISARYEAFLKRSHLPTLEVGRLRFIASEVYKAMNDLSLQSISDLFKSADHNYQTKRATSKEAFQERKRTAHYGLHSFPHDYRHKNLELSLGWLKTFYRANANCAIISDMRIVL